MITARVVCLQVLLLFACVCASLAGEQLTIGTVLEHPESYHLHEVTLHGTARQVQIRGPYASAGGPCYGATTFTLEDETGSIVVDIPGVCGKPLAQDQPRVANGDRVVIHAQIQAPGRYYEGNAPPIFGEDRTTVRAVATEIIRSTN